MSAQVNNGGPAFPVSALKGDEFEGERGLPFAFGMSLRDYAAIEAMKAMLTGHFSHYGHKDYWPRDEVASEAYEMADAMLKSRQA